MCRNKIFAMKPLFSVTINIVHSVSMNNWRVFNIFFNYEFFFCGPPSPPNKPNQTLNNK